jgi:hypothetical protein
MKYDLDDLVVVAKLVGLEKIKKTTARITAKCPFYRHSDGEVGRHLHGDNTPSFVMMQGTQNDATIYVCSCKASGLVKNLFSRLGDLACDAHDFAAAGVFQEGVEALKVLDGGAHLSPKATAPKKAKKSKVEFYEYPDWYINSFPKLIQVDGVVDYDDKGQPLNCIIHTQAYDYLVSRGFKAWQIADADVRVDEKLCMVGFPFRNHNGRWAGMRGRSYLPNDEMVSKNIENNLSDPKSKHYCYTFMEKIEGSNEKVRRHNQSTVWYREHEMTVNRRFLCNRPTIIVESAIDALLIGEEATAMFGLKVNKTKWEFFKGTAGVMFLGDSDRNGNDSPEVIPFREEARKHCTELGIPFYDLYYPEGFKDIGEMAQKDPALVKQFIDKIYQDIWDDFLKSNPDFYNKKSDLSTEEKEVLKAKAVENDQAIQKKLLDDDVAKIANLLLEFPEATDAEISGRLSLDYITIEKARSCLLMPKVLDSENII